MRSAHAQDLFRGSEPEVEGDDSRVVVADGKRETRFFILKRWHRRWTAAFRASLVT